METVKIYSVSIQAFCPIHRRAEAQVITISESNTLMIVLECQAGKMAEAMSNSLRASAEYYLQFADVPIPEKEA